jgi:hypothetical protein
MGLMAIQERLNKMWSRKPKQHIRISFGKTESEKIYEGYIHSRGNRTTKRGVKRVKSIKFTCIEDGGAVV